MNKLTTSSVSSLISLIVFYFILIILMVSFAYLVLNNQGERNNFYILTLWISAIVVPTILLVSIIINLVHLMKERRSKAPGATLKTRLVVYFLILVFLSTVPQALLSLSFIRVIGDTWFNDKIGIGLKNSLDITISVQQAQATDLESFMYSPLFNSLSERVQDDPERLFVQLRQVRPSIVALQVFSDDEETMYFGGDEMAKIEYSDLLGSTTGLVVRDIRQNRSFIRIHNRIHEVSIVLVEELPLGFGEKTIQILEASELFNEYRNIKDLLYTGIFFFYGIFSLPLLFLAILAGFYLSNALIQPVVYLQNAIQKVAEGDFSFRILRQPRAGFASLIGSFNLMVVELEHSRNKLIQSERIAAWKDIAQRLAHEVKNPLTPIKLSIERLEKKYEQQAENFPEILASSITTITREVEHLSKLITEFRDFTRLPLPQPSQVNLQGIVNEIIDMYQSWNVHIAIENNTKETMIYVDQEQFRQVIANLLSNAIEAIEKDKGRIQFSNQFLTASGKHFHRIQIQDNGSGMTRDAISHIFDPYFTTKENGMGLGLAIAQRIIQDHDGKIWVESEAGRGSRFFIDLPALEAL